MTVEQGPKFTDRVKNHLLPQLMPLTARLSQANVSYVQQHDLDSSGSVEKLVEMGREIIVAEGLIGLAIGEMIVRTPFLALKLLTQPPQK